jgi:hypothetical protein
MNFYDKKNQPETLRFHTPSTLDIKSKGKKIESSPYQQPSRKQPNRGNNQSVMPPESLDKW